MVEMFKDSQLFLVPRYLGEHNIIDQLSQPIFLKPDLILDLGDECLHILIEHEMGLLDMFAAEFPYLIEMGGELLDGDGLVVDALVLVLVVESAEAVAADEAVELTELVIADQVVDYPMSFTLFCSKLLHLLIIIISLGICLILLPLHSFKLGMDG